MTEKLFLDEPRLRTATATVLASGADGIVLDRTMFYARSGVFSSRPAASHSLTFGGGPRLRLP